MFTTLKLLAIARRSKSVLFSRQLQMSMTISFPGSSDLSPEPKKTRLACDLALKVKRLTAYATLPSRGSPQAAGYDLYRYATLLGNAALVSAPVLANLQFVVHFCTVVFVWLSDFQFSYSYILHSIE